MEKILAIDIGNTNIVLGVIDVKMNIDNVFRLSVNHNDTSDDLGARILFFINTLNIDIKYIKLAVISSVVPSLDDKIESSIKKYIGVSVYFARIEDMSKHIGIDYKDPSEIGADRIVNSIAALEYYGKPLIIVDLGTANTIDVLTDKGVYSGGMIFQGINMSVTGLFSKTAKLPNLHIKPPTEFIGKSTVDCIRSGIYYSFLGGLDYMITLIKKEKNMSKSKVILTGGWTSLYKNEGIFDYFDENLTLKGLALLYFKEFIK